MGQLLSLIEVEWNLTTKMLLFGVGDEGNVAFLQFLKAKLTYIGR